MSDTSIEKAILAELHRLEVHQQREVLVFTRSLIHTPSQGAAGKNLLRFAGAIDQDDLQKMDRAINEDCEKIDPHEYLLLK